MKLNCNPNLSLEERCAAIICLNIEACILHGAGKYRKPWNCPPSACWEGVHVHAGDFSLPWTANFGNSGAHMETRSS